MSTNYGAITEDASQFPVLRLCLTLTVTKIVFILKQVVFINDILVCHLKHSCNGVELGLNQRIFDIYSTSEDKTGCISNLN